MYKSVCSAWGIALGLAISLIPSVLCTDAAEARGWGRSTSGARGGTLNRQMSQTRTGQGAYARNGSFGGTTASGRAFGGTSSGQGNRSFAQGQGVSNNYQGQVTTNNGQTYGVDRSSNYSKNADGGVDANHSQTVTTPSGQSYTVDKNATYTYAQGSGVSKTGGVTVKGDP